MPNLNKNLKMLFQKENLIVLILSGVLLFIIALPTKESGGGNQTGGKTGEEKLLSLNEITQGKIENGQAGSVLPDETEEAYAVDLEERLTAILEDMAGVGKVKVMITLKSSSERIVEKEVPVNRSATNEEDSQGGSRIVNQVETGDATVYSRTGNDSEPYVVKTLPPEIEGVLVVAEGAGSGSVSRTVTEIVQALFDVEAHKVKVVKMG